MNKKMVAIGRIRGSQKSLEIDRIHFSQDEDAQKVHLSDRQMGLLVAHLCPGPSADKPCNFCAEEIFLLHAHIADCRFCRSKMQALLSSEDQNGPEDRRGSMLQEEVEMLHISTPPERDFTGLSGLHLIDEPDVLFIAD